MKKTIQKNIRRNTKYMSKWNLIQKTKPIRKIPKGNSKTMNNKNLHQIKQTSQKWKTFVMKENITRIKGPTEAQNVYHKWNKDATQQKNTRTVYNTKYKKNLPSSVQDQQTRSLNVENKNQDRYNEQKSSSLQTEHQEQFRFHEQTERSPQARNQERPRYNVPPPNIERNMIINEMNKMGITQKPNTQQDPSEIETNIRAVEQMRQTFRENEKAIKEEIEAQYKTQIINLKRINEEQKEANKQNNATSLSKINIQENTIQTLYKQMNYYKEKWKKLPRPTTKIELTLETRL